MDQIPCNVDDPVNRQGDLSVRIRPDVSFVPQGTNTVSSAETLVLYNPFRVEAVLVATSPRVAAARQPWAILLNRFAVPWLANPAYFHRLADFASS